jgi:hypothetical protein
MTYYDYIVEFLNIIMFFRALDEFCNTLTPPINYTVKKEDFDKPINNLLIGIIIETDITKKYKRFLNYSR